MIDYIKGEITQITPTFLTMETGGIGYLINISITTFSKLEGKKILRSLYMKLSGKTATSSSDLLIVRKGISSGY